VTVHICPRLGRLVDTLALLNFNRQLGKPRILSVGTLLPAAIGFLMEDRCRRFVRQVVGAVEIHDYGPVVLETRVLDGIAFLVQPSSQGQHLAELSGLQPQDGDVRVTFPTRCRGQSDPPRAYDLGP
jgi:hypothetical protein